MSVTKAVLYPLFFVAVFILASYGTISILLQTGATVVCPDVRGLVVEEAKRLAEKSQYKETGPHAGIHW